MNWITDANMVAAVSNAGGMGVLGPNAGAKFEGINALVRKTDIVMNFVTLRSRRKIPLRVKCIPAGRRNDGHGGLFRKNH